MNIVEAYIAGVKELKATSRSANAELFDLLDGQLCDLWDDMSDKEQALASTVYNELWPQR